MSRMKRQLVFLLAVGLFLGLGIVGVQAGGMGGVNVYRVQVCVNGVHFIAIPYDPAALGHPMNAAIYHGHVGSGIAAVTGTVHTFSAVGEVVDMYIYYSPGTFSVGEPVTVSAISTDLSGYGGGVFTTVERCGLMRPPVFTDGRLNSYEPAAPVVIYMSNGGFQFWAVNPSTSAGQEVLNLSADDIKSAGIPEGDPVLLGSAKNPFTGVSISLYRLPDGTFQLNTAYADGKAYIVQWTAGGELTDIAH